MNARELLERLAEQEPHCGNAWIHADGCETVLTNQEYELIKKALSVLAAVEEAYEHPKLEARGLMLERMVRAAIERIARGD